MRTLRLLPLALIVAAMITGLPSSSAQTPEPVAMSLSEKVGQLVMFSVGGTSLTPTERALIKDNHLGGVILFAQNYDNRSQLKALTNQIQRAARNGNQYSIGALISVDQEGGVVKRFPDMPPRYSAPQIGASDGTWLAWNQGKETGAALHDSGVNVDFAPVADLDEGPAHIMSQRSFGSDPRRVGQLVRRFGRGLQSKRVVATAKHFPGLGGATSDSDAGRTEVRRSRWQIRHVDALPFREAIASGLRMMMLSHALYIHERGNRPASLNHFIATKRLRRDLGFDGVAVSDALNAVAWRFGGSTARACRATVRAGVDIALITSNAYVARDCAAEIKRGVKSGSISEARLDQAVARVLALKEWLGLYNP